MSINLLTDGPDFEIKVVTANTLEELHELMSAAIEGTTDRSIVSRYMWRVLERSWEIGHDTF